MKPLCTNESAIVFHYGFKDFPAAANMNNPCLNYFPSERDHFARNQVGNLFYLTAVVVTKGKKNATPLMLIMMLNGRKKNEKKSVSGRLVLFDGDHTEMTYAAAELLADVFSKVTIVTPRERIATDCSLVNRQQIYQRLYDRRVEILTSHVPASLDDLEDGRLRVANVYNANEQLLDGIAAITYATARAPSDELRSPLAAEGFDVVTIGDCHAPRALLAATRQGYQVGNGL